MIEPACGGPYFVHLTCTSTRSSQAKVILKKNDVVDALQEFSACVMSHSYKTSVARTDVESVYVHGASSKHCADHGVKVSPSAPYLEYVNGQAEQHFGVVMGMAILMFKTSGLPDKYCDRAVQHATYLKNASHHLLLVTGCRMRWCFSINLIFPICVLLAHVCRRGNRLKNARASWPTELEPIGMSAIRIQTRYALCSAQSPTECFTEIENMVFEDVDLTVVDMSAEHLADVNNDSFIEHYVFKP